MVVIGLAISRYAVGTEAYPKRPHVKQHGGPRYAAAIGTCHMQGTPRSSGLADGDHIDDMPLSTLRVVALGATHPPRSTQMRRQLLLQHTAGLNEETAIDRFVR